MRTRTGRGSQDSVTLPQMHSQRPSRRMNRLTMTRGPALPITLTASMDD
jgi:hypothetical protein